VDLHPPEKLLIFVCEDTLELSNFDTTMYELVEGLILIGATEISIVMSNGLVASLTNRSHFSDWINKTHQLIKNCRPYVKLDLINVDYAIANSEKLDIDDIIIIHAGSPTDAEKEFLELTEDVYVMNKRDFSLGRYTNVLTDLKTADVEPINAVIVDMVHSMQILLLINILSKPSIYKKSEMSFTAVDFVEMIMENVVDELRLQRNLSREISDDAVNVFSVFSGPSESEIGEYLNRYNVKNLTELAKLKGIIPATLRTRLKLGWDIETALNTPSKERQYGTEF
jgi:hypothetical protein